MLGLYKRSIRLRASHLSREQGLG